MKILLVAGYFPPNAPSAATRANKLAAYLLARGHDVRVLTQGGLAFPPVLSPEIPAEKIYYSKTLDVRTAPDILIRALGRALRRRPPPEGADRRAPVPAGGARAEPPSRPRSPLKKVRSLLSDLYLGLVCWPDPYVGWLPWAVREGLGIIADWRPDLIYSSAPPHTSNIVARRLSRRTSIPWVCELRDLWVDHPYYDAPAWRRWVEGIHERRVLGAAAALVTVTAPWAELLAAKYGKPTLLVMNGFDPLDFPEQPPDRAGDVPNISIRYLGALYHDKRDPTALFEALRLLGAEAKNIRVQFYGPDLQFAKSLRDRFELGPTVELHDPVPYTRSVELQRTADILLLLRWDDPGETSVIAGKVFEYLGARRPILSVGSTEGVVADMIRARGAGLVSRSPEEIAAQLGQWLAEKTEKGTLPTLPLTVRQGFSRTEQFERLETFLEAILAESEPRVHGSGRVRAGS